MPSQVAVAATLSSLFLRDARRSMICAVHCSPRDLFSWDSCDCEGVSAICHEVCPAGDCES